MGKTLIQIQKRGWQALVKELGIADATKFMMCYEAGEGNYTRCRRKTVKKIRIGNIVRQIKEDRKKDK